MNNDPKKEDTSAETDQGEKLPAGAPDIAATKPMELDISSPGASGSAGPTVTKDNMDETEELEDAGIVPTEARSVASNADEDMDEREDLQDAGSKETDPRVGSPERPEAVKRSAASPGIPTKTRRMNNDEDMGSISTVRRV